MCFAGLMPGPQDLLPNAKTAIGALWGQAAPHYDQAWGHGLKSASERQAWSEFLARQLPPARPARILDAGCGTGFLALLLAEAGHSVVGLDLSEQMLAVARKRAASGRLRARFVRADAEVPVASAGTFDAIVSRHLLWTLPRPDLALAAWREMLVPGGVVLAIDEFWPDLRPARRLVIGAGRLAGRLTGDSGDRAYPADLAARLPLNHLPGPEPVADLFGQAGLAGVTVAPLTHVDRVERKSMPLRLRLTYDYRRYLISGRKPAPPGQ